ncbi:uncharacterized protein LOC141907512 [Tubulanus polymorphus]|uniref:uncharacterized protein LOC141907512 n=1 Tax=Tubulanus polymorphus TaxID=672921 RepID=UPI003DA609C2
MMGATRYFLYACLFLVIWHTQTLKVVATNSFKASISVVSHNDWAITRELKPKFTEDIVVNDLYPEDAKTRKTIEFTAFNREWTIEVQVNPLFVSDDTSFDFRSLKGHVISSEKPPRDCYYIGEVRAGPTEVGEAIVTTCYGKFRAMMITNLNDYMINPPLPITTPREYKKRDIPDADLPSHTEHGQHSTRAKRNFPDFPEDWDIHIGPLPSIKGRKMNTEVTLIVDETFINDYHHAFGGERQDVYDYILNMFAFVQLWYVNPTLGFQNWVTLRKIIFVEDQWSIYLEDGTKYGLLASCEWQKRVFKDSGEWTVAAMISVQDQIWGGIGGLAFPGRGCRANNGGSNCLGVMHQSFQIDTLARALAHELAHSLGVPDDYAPPTSGLCKSGMMGSGLYEDREWSWCTVQRMEQWLHVNGSECVHFENSPRANLPNLPVLPVNVAWRARVKQSSTQFDEEVEFGGWKATDGSLAPIPFQANPDSLIASFTRTKLQKDPWLLVELDDIYKDNYVESVRIYNRVDCCPERLHDFEVRIGNDRNFLSNSLCAKFQGAVPGGKNGMADIQCSQPMRGKYVSIQIPGQQEIISVSEVAVMQYIDIGSVKRHFKCIDQKPICQYTRYTPDACNEYWGKKDCQQTCGHCSRGLPVIPFDSSANEPGTDVGIFPSCVDNSRECWHLLANNRCHEPHIMGRCPRSCAGCAD